jgi:hypothetical protein
MADQRRKERWSVLAPKQNEAGGCLSQSLLLLNLRHSVY